MGKFYSTGVVHQFRCTDDYGSQFILQRPSDNADIQCVYRNRVDAHLLFIKDGETVMVCGDLDDSGHCFVNSVEIMDKTQFPSQDE